MIQAFGSTFKKQTKSPSLLQQKRDLDVSLAGLTRRIVVTIDDVDRLEPQEVIELLRLIRSVADFRNIIYILCFDGEILAHRIEAGISVTNGHAYLEKIIQISLSVPIPEPFHLRRWFEKELSKLVCVDSFESSQRLARAIDQEGGRRFRTPRAVTKTLNALSILIPALDGRVDLADLVWLQIIKAGNQKLYRWIEDYLTECAAISGLRVSVSDSARKQTISNLPEIFESDRASLEDYKYELPQYLPGVKMFTLPVDKDETPLFHISTDEEIEKAIRGKRLASPDHYRLYFALAQPFLAPRAEDFQSLIAAANTSVQSIEKLVIDWVELQDLTIGTKADVMLNRIRQRAADALSTEQAKRIFISLSNVLDDAGKRGTMDEFRSPSLWREAERCISVFRAAMTPNDFEDTLKKSFEEGKALGWLTDLLRGETFSHGRFGNRKTHESEWLFTEQEFNLIAGLMVARYYKMTYDDFLKLPRALDGLFAWQQTGDSEGPRKLVGAAAKTDEGLILVLESMSSIVRSSEGDYRTLNPDSIKHFLDYEIARNRIVTLRGDEHSNLASKAKELLKQFKSHDHF